TLHVAWFTSKHPALWYATWSNGVLTREVVDTLGFNVGGRIGPAVQLSLDSAGVPHIVYARDDQVWFAMKSGGTWVHERVDSAALNVYDVASVPPSLALTSTGS